MKILVASKCEETEKVCLILNIAIYKDRAFKIAIVWRKRLLKSAIEMELQRYIKNMKYETFNYGKVGIENAIRKFFRKLKTYSRLVICTSTEIFF